MKWKRKQDLNKRWEQRREDILVIRGFKKIRLLSIKVKTYGD